MIHQAEILQHFSFRILQTAFIIWVSTDTKILSILYFVYCVSFLSVTLLKKSYS